MSALGEKTGTDEKSNMELLEKISKVKIPASLSALDKKSIIHTDRTDKDSICDFIKRKTGII